MEYTRPEPDPVLADRRSELRADCASCFGLCCVAPAFSASTDFAVDKPAGQPCTHLQTDFRCGIHADLRDRGYPGCTVFDCFGAGQRIARSTFDGQDWRTAPETATQMFEAFTVMRQLHELLWYLAEARSLAAARPVHDELGCAVTEIERAAAGRPEELLVADLPELRRGVDALLLRTSELVRAGIGRRIERRGADLIGRNLRGADLRGANLRGAYLIGADLRAADLGLADLIGADLRGADLRGATVTTSLFLTQFQVNGAKGDATTGLPRVLIRPPHWTATLIPVDEVISRSRRRPPRR